MSKKPVSIFNEVLGPVMRGPSSSHTAGAYRIGMVARELFGRKISRILVSFSSKGSLPTTYVSQGSEIGLMAGLLNVPIEDEKVPHIMDYVRSLGIAVETVVHDKDCQHPNIYEVTLEAEDGYSMDCVGVSVGGGMSKVVEVNGLSVDIDGDEDIEIPGIGRLSRVLPVGYDRNAVLPFRDAESFALMDPDREMWEYALDYESARTGMDRDYLFSLAGYIYDVMRTSVNTGLNGTVWADRILGQQSHLVDAASRKGVNVPSPLLHTLEKYAMAVMECKSSYGLIVAVPTAGSCAVVPSVILSLCDLYGYSKDMAVKALLAVGLIGVFIAERSTFSAEVAGCQAECGAASGMAAAGVVQLCGGSSGKAAAAASFALQNILGMVCDPIAKRVEAPCLGKNVMCALNAVSAADMVLAGADALLPLHEVIAAMDEVGRAIPREYRCTGLGGLSMCPTSLKIEETLSGKQNG